MRSRLRPPIANAFYCIFADLLETNAEDLAQLETLNQGDSINLSRTVDVGAAAEYVRYTAGSLRKP